MKISNFVENKHVMKFVDHLVGQEIFCLLKVWKMIL